MAEAAAPAGSKIVIRVTLKSMPEGGSHSREALKRLVAAGTLRIEHPKLADESAVATVEPGISSESLVGEQRTVLLLSRLLSCAKHTVLLHTAPLK
eukprot:SAG31_NODE_4658_length_3062_cov_12.086736_1_plen_96_part_00